MSETIIDHGYVPEEHAPDPIIGHGDPTPPGKVAIWMFLASEIMFFIGILGTYIILRSGSAALFSNFAGILSPKLAASNTLVLILSSLTMALAVHSAHHGRQQRTALFLLITLACAFGFMGIKYVEYTDKWWHYTVVYRDSASGKLMVADGHVNKAQTNDKQIALEHTVMMEAPTANFDIHNISPSDIAKGSSHGGSAEAGSDHHGQDLVIPRSAVSTAMNYFPWRNMFFGCYFALTGVHGVHVIGGIIPIFILMVQAFRGRLLPEATEYVGLYWHFVDLVWIFLFPMLYLI